MSQGRSIIVADETEAMSDMRRDFRPCGHMHVREAAGEERATGQESPRGVRSAKVKRAHKTELKPNAGQRGALAKHAGSARFAYNWGLARKIESYRLTGKSPTAIDLHRELNSLEKSTYPWLYEVSKCAPQEALRDLDRAYANFFRRSRLKVKGEYKRKVGFPRFKSRRNGSGSFRLQGPIQVEDGRVKLPRLGWMRLHEKGYLPRESDSLHIFSATVSEKAGRWFCSLQVEEERPEPERPSGPAIGIDLGVKTIAAC